MVVRNEFKHTPLSTEKSRQKEIVARLALENRMREEMILKYTHEIKSSKRWREQE